MLSDRCAGGTLEGRAAQYIRSSTAECISSSAEFRVQYSAVQYSKVQYSSEECSTIQGVEVPEGSNELRKMQLRELALLNGTLREDGMVS